MTPSDQTELRQQQIAKELLALPVGTNKPLQWDMDVLVAYIAAAEQRAASKAIYGMHDSIMAHKLVLGTEADQAFNYARIHKWIDAEVAELGQAVSRHRDL